MSTSCHNFYLFILLYLIESNWYRSIIVGNQQREINGRLLHRINIQIVHHLVYSLMFGFIDTIRIYVPNHHQCAHFP